MMCLLCCLALFASLCVVLCCVVLRCVDVCGFDLLCDWFALLCFVLCCFVLYYGALLCIVSSCLILLCLLHCFAFGLPPCFALALCCFIVLHLALF